MLTIHSGTPEQTDSRGNQLADSISISSFAVLNKDLRHKTPWECQPQFSRCLISISLSHHLVRLANAYDHEL